jgi:hypothetical protein
MEELHKIPPFPSDSIVSTTTPAGKRVRLKDFHYRSCVDATLRATGEFCFRFSTPLVVLYQYRMHVQFACPCGVRVIRDGDTELLLYHVALCAVFHVLLFARSSQMLQQRQP